MIRGSVNLSLEREKESKQVEIRTNHQTQIQRIEEFLEDDTDKPDITKKQTNKHVSSHLVISCTLSFIILLSASYWEYTARSMEGFHHKWAHFTVCLGFATINLLPSIGVSMSMYAPISSIAVIIYSVWFIFHIFGAWVFDICAYNALTEMCVAVAMYKNISICLLIGVVMHQWIVLFGHFYNKSRTKKKIEKALTNAENLDITDIDENEEKLEAGMNEKDDTVKEAPSLNEAEFDKMYRRFVDHQLKKVGGCKYCSWTHECIKPENASDGRLEIVIIDAEKERRVKYENLTITVPKSSTNVHAIPVVFEKL